MSLLSQLFSGDRQLLAAATSDRGHITPGARGPHVAKIQEALNRVGGAKLAVDSQYGPQTAAAVVVFKTRRNILNTSGRIDNIVGIKTVAALDSELSARERGGAPGVAGGNRQALTSPAKVGDAPLVLPPDFIGPLVLPPDVIAPTFPKRHLLVYFSGVVDQEGMGGVVLARPHGQDVLTDMENLPTPRAGEDKKEIGFGGSLVTTRGVEQALVFIRAMQKVSAAPSKLILYGFSAGGVNAMELCRRLAQQLPGVLVDLLVTIDVAAGRGTSSLDRSVPDNVLRNQNFFQTAPSLNGSHGAPNVGKNVSNTNVDSRFGRTLDFIPFIGKTERHGAMQDVTRQEAVFFMRRTLNEPPRIL